MDVTPSPTRAPSALVSLLEVVDGPALLLDSVCRVVGANEELLAMASARGVSLLERASDLLPRLVASDLPESSGVVLHRTIELGEEEPCEARLLRLEGLSEQPLTLMVLERSADTGESASGRRSNRLRHDLAGPLTAILGTAELLLMREGGLDGETREALEEILGQCTRISELIARDREVDAGDVNEAP